MYDNDDGKRNLKFADLQRISAFYKISKFKQQQKMLFSLQ